MAKKQEQPAPGKDQSTPKKEQSAQKKEQTAPKKENRIVRYFKEVRAELRKVVWPSRKATTNLTLIVLGVSAAMSISLGIIDWLLSKLFGWIVG